MSLARSDIVACLGCAVTPLHRDPYFNLFCQIFGAKRIQLVHPSQSSDVQPFSSPIVLRNTSEIDMDEVDARVGDNKTGQPWDVTLQPGEILYIPKGWCVPCCKSSTWHCVCWHVCLPGCDDAYARE